MENAMRLQTRTRAEDRAACRKIGCKAAPIDLEPQPVNIIRQFPEQPDGWRKKRERQLKSEVARQIRRHTADALKNSRAEEGTGARERAGTDQAVQSACGQKRPITINRPPTLRRLVARALYRRFVLKPYAAKCAKEQMKLRIVGGENLAGLKRGVIVMNNADSGAPLALLRALKNRPFKLVYDGFQLPTPVCRRLGKAGMLLCRDASDVSDFDKRVEYCSQRDIFLLFHPEKTLMWRCEQPRPFSPEAFECAARHNLPIVPAFMAFQPTGNKDASGAEIKYLTLFVLPPVYPDPAAEYDAERLSREVYGLFEQKYEQFYGKQP